ncbi:hypothetical protein ABIB42_005192 [Massilia sp. UYP32]|jgi:hypothetical protein|uniref:Rap1a immunity protein domain-containing protein n=1 Tax=Massilia timonae CCUG 45783 TaxID=883126 RepID=K9DD37_9BURK|nr:Rap1a/Tai family immunity protein [Massilia timonae]EKU82173.1 hypothetical protein HMPREF9710_02484 [Massilia timonae CCUG 45783]
MKRAALFLTLVVACGAAARPLGVFPWHLSGNDFVSQVAGQAQRPDAAYAQRYAEGYQAGVVDATQGKLWCAPPGMKPTEVDDRIWAELRNRAGTMPGSAADELVRLYAARFPCPAGR